MVAKRGRAALAAAGLGVVVAAGSSAGAQEAPPVVVADDVELSTAADGVATFSARVTVTGADGPTVISILVDGSSACLPLSQPVVSPGVPTAISLKLPETCDLADSASIEFVTYPFGSVMPTPSGTTVIAEVEAADPSPPYANLAWGFGLGAAFAVMATVLAWKLGPNARGGRWPLGLGEGLPGLNGKWTWESSQLTSVTVVAALFTGLLGSTDVLAKILGDEAEGPVAVVVVASALATALVGAAPFILALLRDEPETYGTTDAPNNYRASGVLCATALVEIASVGLVLSIAWTLWDSEIPNVWIAVGAVAAAVLAVVYGARSMRRTLKIGMVESKAEQAVREAAKAVRQANRGRTEAALVTAASACEAAESAIDEASRRLGEPPPGADQAATAVTTAKATQESACDALRAATEAARHQPGMPERWTPAARSAVALVETMAGDIATSAKAVDAFKAVEVALTSGAGGVGIRRASGAAEARQLYREPALP